MKTVIDPQKEIPVHAEADVIVVGGGPAGIGAALASARNGAKTILIEQFGSLGGLQTQCFNTCFSFVDPEIQGGVIRDIMNRLQKGGGMMKDASADTRQMRGMGGVFFDAEYYKFLLDNMMAEAGVKLLYHAFGVGAIREGSTLKGIFIESLEGKMAILAKVIIDTTGSADIAWKSGASVLSGGFTYGPKQGRTMGYGYSFFLGGVDVPRLKQLRKEQPENWGTMHAGAKLIAKAKAEGKLTAMRESYILSEVYRGPRIWVMGGHHPVPAGHQNWELETLTEGEIHLRQGAWGTLNLLKENVPGFENAYMEKTPNIPVLRDTHRVHGEYILSEQDMRAGRAFDDSIAISNMWPDIFGPDYEHGEIWYPPPYDIPYRSLVSKDTDNLLGAGATVSADFVAWAAVRYCAPSICTGEAAGTAAALAVKNNVTPKKLNVKTLQNALRKQGARVTVKEVPKPVMDEYNKTVKRLAANKEETVKV
ncbi:MAG: FAD-dependent oxidoreductase [Dehalococcoidales bacterium]|nr:FAD-dependent oxidoreductase [Dehalococcoidales bacterium]